jgi:hypothetical protein
MTDISFTPSKLPVFATFKKAFQVSLKSGGRILLFSLLFLAVYFAAALIVGLLAALVGTVVAERLNLNPGSPGFILAILAVAVPGFLAILVIAFRFSFGLTRLADAACDGRTLKFADILRNPRPNLLVYIALSLALGLMTLVGLLAFIVPGFMVMTAFALAPIAMILEDKGLRDSLTRSRELTKGNRWRFFAIYLLVNLAFLPFSLGSNLVAQRLQASGNVQGSILVSLSTIVVSLLVSVFIIVLYVVVFRELRALKDRPAAVAAPVPDPQTEDDGVPA